jgi:dihydroorotate dehydrogenase (fumarate)
MSQNIDLSVKYMGLDLKSPIIASSSDFTNKVDSIVELAEAGVGAVVLKSLFEEQIMYDIDSMRMNNMFDSYAYTEDYISYYTKQHEVGKYLELISESKKRTNIPVIASINCSTASEWMSFAKNVEQAGADAIELNVFVLPSDPEKSADYYRKLYFDVIDGVKQNSNLPIAVKLHYYFTDLAAFMVELSEKADSLVLFNRFFSPDIDLNKMKITSGGSFSNPSDHFQVLRWIGILNGKLNSSLSASGGVHDASAVLKSVVAGADVVQIASVLYTQGVAGVTQMINGIEEWLREKNYSSIREIKGLLSQNSISSPALYERAQFMKYFSDFNHSKD